MRAMAASTSSIGFTSRRRTRSACAVASSDARSCMVEENAMSDRAAFAVIGLLTLAVVGLVGALMTGDGGARPATLDVTALPLLNACLNTLSAGFLVAGWIFIRRRQIAAHVTCMLSAFVVSALFLLSYVVY